MMKRLLLGGALCTTLLASDLAAQHTDLLSESPSQQANGPTCCSAISPDGRYVAFASDANNLVSGDTNPWPDIFLANLSSPGAVEKVSVAAGGAQADGPSVDPDLSVYGVIVVFSSTASNLVSGDTNGLQDIFLRNMWNQTTTRINVSSSGVQANGLSLAPSISSGAGIVVFSSMATNLVPGDTNGTRDIFIHDVNSGQTTRVVGPQGQANDACYSPAISGDSRFIAFASGASNLVGNDTNGQWDIFVYDRMNGSIVRVDIPTFGQSNGASLSPAISEDGRFIVFESDASNLVNGDTNTNRDVFLHDRDPDGNGIFDEGVGYTEMASRNRWGNAPNGWSYWPAISLDGRYVTYQTEASDIVAGDSNGKTDIIIYDSWTGSSTRASVATGGLEGNADSFAPDISRNGRHVVFTSDAANLVSGDTNQTRDLFLWSSVPPASESSYGNGWPGTYGIPSLTASGPPRLGTPLSINVGNSKGAQAMASLMIGSLPANVHTRWDGALLVVPRTTTTLLLGGGGMNLAFNVPYDLALGGVSIYMQVIEFDAGASKGISFTPGLRLDLGE